MSVGLKANSSKVSPSPSPEKIGLLTNVRPSRPRRAGRDPLTGYVDPNLFRHGISSTARAMSCSSRFSTDGSSRRWERCCSSNEDAHPKITLPGEPERLAWELTGTSSG